MGIQPSEFWKLTVHEYWCVALAMNPPQKNKKSAPLFSDEEKQQLLAGRAKAMRSKDGR